MSGRSGNRGGESMRIFAKRLVCLLLAGCAFLAAGCSGRSADPQRYSRTFLGSFDTVITLTAYAGSEEEFSVHADYAQARFEELSRMYDRFYEYDGVSNICTVNKNAGIAPVAVPEEVLDLVELTLSRAEQTGGQVNIAMGPVLSVWRDYMSRASDDPENARLPETAELETAAGHIDPAGIVTDRAAGTLYLAEPGMSLDLGAVGKGYAAQLVADELYARGLTSFIISAGGNVVVGDPPADGSRENWGIGIQDPFADPDDPQAPVLDAVFASGCSVVTSGDYQRYYMVGDRRVHHIIDPDTLMPADYYRGLTVVCADSGEADYASTCLFTMPYEESRALAERMGWKALWIFPDGRVECTGDMLPLLRDRGGAGA